LKGVGRLDVLTAVNRRALDYYQKQDLAGLPEGSLERRARILHVMGEDDMRRGEVDRALAQFREAARATSTLLTEDPTDPERMMAHAQSEFWVGYVDFDRENYAAAKAAFERYKSLADKLVAIDGRNAEWRKEAGFAEGNLCSIALESPADVRAALRSCAAALHNMERAAAILGDGSLDGDLANRHGWLADAHRANGDWRQALAERRAQERLLRRMLAARPEDAAVKERWILLQISMADFYARGTDRPAARRNLKEALAMLDSMIARDPENVTLASRKHELLRGLNKLNHYDEGGNHDGA
jgi:tetratricopeptide (TPR) repeat protein